MANFELGIIVEDLEIPFTRFKSNITNIFNDDNNNEDNYDYSLNSYIEKENIVSEYNYSFEEQLNLHKNGKAELNFKMQKFVMLDSNFTFNPFINHIYNGTIIYLKIYEYNSNKNTIRYFWINNIAYQFSKINIIYSISCQDFFSYSNSRRNNGYEIKNNIEDIDFLGAKTINEWGEKIATDCKMDYKFTRNQYCEKISIAFSISNSNAYNALVALGEKAGLMLNIRELSWKEKFFYFTPLKKDNFNEWYYSPNIDLRTFSLSQSSDTLISVLNVEPKQLSNGKILNLLPDEIEKILPLLQETINVRHIDGLKQIYKKEDRWSFILDESEIKRDSFYRPISEEWVEKRFSYFYCMKKGEQTAQEFRTEEEVFAYFFANDFTLGFSKDFVQDYNNYYYSISYFSSIIRKWKNKTDEDFLTTEEQQLIESLDRIPWLDNKIIDLNYFENFNLVNSTYIKEIYQLLCNDLRRANINLLYNTIKYKDKTAEYYQVLLKSEEEINHFLMNFNSNVINKKVPVEENGQDFKDAPINILALETYYNEVLWSKDKKRNVINCDQQISYYAKNLYNYQQLFLKAAYFFHQKKIDLKNKKIIIQDEEGEKIIYKDEIEQNILIDDLTSIWKDMYNASWHCEFFIPKTFIKKQGKDILIVNQEYVPNVIQYKWDKTITDGRNYEVEKIILHRQNDTRPVSNTFLDKYINSADRWEIKRSMTNTIDFYEEDSNNPGIKWSELPSQNNWNLPFTINFSSSIIGGIESMELCYWLKYYNEDNSNSIINYNSAVSKQKEVWEKIYKKFGKYFLEHSYKDEYAINSDQLYQNAKSYFEDISAPETKYSLSIIDIKQLSGYNKKHIQISDQIRLAADAFYGENDLLKEILNQPLFVTDISYNLRSDDDIKLTVNTVKYQDKIIQRLVSLIK